MSVQFKARVEPDGVHVDAGEQRFLKRNDIPFIDWSTLSDRQGVAGRRLATMVENDHAWLDNDGLVIDHAAAAALPASMADTLGLPPLANLSASLSFENRIEQPDGKIRVQWHDNRSRRVHPSRTGTFVTIGNEIGRLTYSLYELMEAIGGYNASQGEAIETRIACWQPVQESLGRTTGKEVRADGYLSSLTIYQAGAFALDVRETNDGPSFTPVLMSRSMASTGEDDAPVPDEGEDNPAPDLRHQETDALLPPALQRKFAAEKWDSSRATRDAYVLDRNVYVVLELALKNALDVVGTNRRAPAEQRRTFIQNPRPAIADALGDSESADLFVETEQYSDRVLGLGVWEPPKLSWMSKESQQWLPEGFTIDLGGRSIELQDEDVERIRSEIETAETEGRDQIEIDGVSHPINEVEAALPKLAEPEAQDASPETTDDINANENDDHDVLLLRQNIEATDYVGEDRRRHAAIPKAMPAVLMGSTTPKPHQEEGFDWLLDAWISGWPGVLLADDMGLGKTFQALAFMAWITANKHGPGRSALTDLQRGPILIVAPTALLNNWKAEAERHLATSALGECMEAFGNGLKRLKRPKDAEWSPEDALDIERLREADWILTTYETLADNHRSFARVGFALAVFDEIQKIKNPGTINTHGAKAVNVDFVLGMTGTPIENRIEDLWCIMDRIAPGYLGDLKTFSAAHKDGDPDSRKALKSKLDMSNGDRPPPMLRRMKERHVQGLPEKTIIPYDMTMPPPQAVAYTVAVETAKQAGGSHGVMLKAIHALRGISLHPERDGDIDPCDPKASDAWLANSARLAQAMTILERIDALGEKAIVFIEDRAVQKTFASVVATRFNLKAEPAIINGAVPGARCQVPGARCQVPGARRQAIVDQFQDLPPGFALLILSPKAAGIGLTITAANHVIHLSRWWNPAVEDQCNDRVYRIGQDKPVSIHLPMAVHPAFGERSFDRNLNALLARKRDLAQDMLVPPVSDSDVDLLFGQTVGS